MRLAAFSLGLAALLAVSLRPSVAVYHGLNAGIVASVAGHCVGLEWQGSPGAFFDTDCN